MLKAVSDIAANPGLSPHPGDGVCRKLPFLSVYYNDR